MSAQDRYLCQHHAAMLNEDNFLTVKSIAATNSDRMGGAYVTSICEQYTDPVLASRDIRCDYEVHTVPNTPCTRVYRFSVEDRTVYISAERAARRNTAQDVPA